MTVYYELAVEINPVFADIVCDFIYENFSCEGIITGVEEYKKTELTKAVYNIVKAYITDENPDIEKIRRLFQEKRELTASQKIFPEEPGSWNVTLSEQKQEDWSKKWKESWKPSHISDLTVICPSWETYIPKNNERVIILDPGNAFGTGTHATTRLCAKAIEESVNPGDTVADIGCGSGILSFCAVKQGASHVDAVDTDSSAVETAFANAQINSLSDRISFLTATSSSLASGKYDFVAANILHNVLAEIMPDLKRILKKGGKIVLSGILNEKEKVVIDALSYNNLKIINHVTEGEWSAFVAERED